VVGSHLLGWPVAVSVGSRGAGEPAGVLAEIVRLGRAGSDVEAALGVCAGGIQDELHVPLGVVVGVERLVPVAGGATGAQIVSGSRDGVGGIVDILSVVVVAVDAVGVPGALQELHGPFGASHVGTGPDARAGAAAVVRLDLADSGQDV